MNDQAATTILVLVCAFLSLVSAVWALIVKGSKTMIRLPTSHSVACADALFGSVWG